MTGAAPAAAGTSAGTPGSPAAAASDGRTVALDSPAQAIAAGGDTPLGRIMARALLAGDQTGDTPPAGPVATPIIGNLRPLDGSPRGATALGTIASTGTAADTAALDAFLQGFATALASADAAPGSGRGDGNPATTADAAAAPAPAAASAANTQPALSFAIPFVPDAAPVAPPTPASTLPQAQPVDANAVVDQILRGMAIRTTDGQSEVRLRLVPENLGDVSVKLTVTGGNVDATLTAHTADAQSALAGGQNQLAKTLADAGLKLQSFTVGLAGGGFADTRDQSRPNDSWNRPNPRRLGGVEAVDAAEPDDITLLASSSFGPPIYSAQSLPGTLNRLV